MSNVRTQFIKSLNEDGRLMGASVWIDNDGNSRDLLTVYDYYTGAVYGKSDDKMVGWRVTYQGRPYKCRIATAAGTSLFLDPL